MLPERKGINEISPVIAQTFCLKEISAEKGKEIQTVVSLGVRDKDQVEGAKVAIICMPEYLQERELYKGPEICIREP